MSYDLTIRSDGTYSRSTPRAALESFIKELPGIKRNGKLGFVLDVRPKRWMEIDLEVVNEEGDNIEDNKQVSAGINCIRLHIPYKFLGDDIEEGYLPTAFAIAEHVGWTLYDDQDDEPVLKADSEEETASRPAVFDRKKFIGEWVAFPYSWGNTRMNYEITDDGRFKAQMFGEDGALELTATGNGIWLATQSSGLMKLAKVLPSPNVRNSTRFCSQRKSDLAFAKRVAKKVNFGAPSRPKQLRRLSRSKNCIRFWRS